MNRREALAAMFAIATPLGLGDEPVFPLVRRAYSFLWAPPGTIYVTSPDDFLVHYQESLKRHFSAERVRRLLGYQSIFYPGQA